MIRNNFCCLLILLTAFTACDRGKPKPVSQDITRTAVLVKGKKDSVRNNPRANYGNSTLSGPCVQCLLQIIQGTNSFKQLTVGVKTSAIKYTVNWAKAGQPRNLDNGRKITNGIAVDVNVARQGSGRIGAYLYNNQDSTLYLLDKSKRYLPEAQTINTIALKRIRNSCYWGVASGK